MELTNIKLSMSKTELIFLFQMSYHLHILPHLYMQILCPSQISTFLFQPFIISFFIYKFIYFIYLSLADWVFIAAHGLSLVVASGGFSCCGSRALGSRASVVVARALWSADSVVAHGLSCSAACEVFLDQGSNLCPLPWQADS